MNADPRSGLTTHDLTAHPRYRKMAGELRNLRKQLADRSEEAKAKRRAYKQSAPVKERARKWRRNRRPRLRDYQREYKKRKFGATPEPELCEICGGWSLRALALDHDHKTEKFRGWLCSYCNTGLGLFFDDPARLRAAADYLERNKA